MKVNGFEGEGFDPKDWHVDLQSAYVTHFPSDMGFSVGIRSRDFKTDGFSPGDFIAEPVHLHFPAWGDVPGREELARLLPHGGLSLCHSFHHSLLGAREKTNGAPSSPSSQP